MNWPARLVQGATNSIKAYVRLSRNVHDAPLKSIPHIIVQEVVVKYRESQYGEEEVKELAGV
jgi:hypothetical protein